MKLAFYKGPGTFVDKLIRVITRSKYSHCEIVIDGVFYSSSIQDGGVRSKVINQNSGHWDFIEINGDIQKIKKWFKDHDDEKYDFFGAFGSILPFFSKKNNTWFCSEACAEALGLPNSGKYSPQELFEVFSK